MHGDDGMQGSSSSSPCVRALACAPKSFMRPLPSPAERACVTSSDDSSSKFLSRSPGGSEKLRAAQQHAGRRTQGVRRSLEMAACAATTS